MQENQPAGGLLLKKLKYFEIMFNIFDFSRVWENIVSWLVYENKHHSYYKFVLKFHALTEAALIPFLLLTLNVF